MRAYAGIVFADSSRVPDTILWNSRSDSGYGKLGCDNLACTDTLSLARTLGSDTAHLRLWALGIRCGTIPFVQSGRSPYLDAVNASITRDSLDLRLLSAFRVLRGSKPDSLAAFGTPRSDLVYCYAKFVLGQETGFEGFPSVHPVGMSIDSIGKALVYWGAKSAMSWSQLVAASLGLDSATVRADAAALFQAGRISATDTSALFPSSAADIAPPTITPAGAVYSATQTGTATLSSSVSGATLWYSADTGASKTWTRYSTGISIAKSQILYARAILGDAVSAPDSAVFLYVPTIAPTSGSYAAGQVVTISVLGSPAIEDSSGAGSAWRPYEALTLQASAKVCARSRLGGATPDKVCASFVLPPSLSPASGTYADRVVVNATDAGADSIQFSADTSVASGWAAGTSRTLTSSGRLFARSFLGAIVSPVASAEYVVPHGCVCFAGVERRVDVGCGNR
jgi:hypothetical protein